MKLRTCSLCNKKVKVTDAVMGNGNHFDCWKKKSKETVDERRNVDVNLTKEIRIYTQKGSDKIRPEIYIGSSGGYTEELLTNEQAQEIARSLNAVFDFPSDLFEN